MRLSVLAVVALCVTLATASVTSFQQEATALAQDSASATGNICKHARGNFFFFASWWYRGLLGRVCGRGRASVCLLGGGPPLLRVRPGISRRWCCLMCCFKRMVCRESPADAPWFSFFSSCMCGVIRLYRAGAAFLGCLGLPGGGWETGVETVGNLRRFRRAPRASRPPAERTCARKKKSVAILGGLPRFGATGSLVGECWSCCWVAFVCRSAACG